MVIEIEFRTIRSAKNWLLSFSYSEAKMKKYLNNQQGKYFRNKA